MIVGGHTPWDTKIKPKHQKVFADVSYHLSIYIFPDYRLLFLV
jgi:hypothetical protein